VSAVSARSRSRPRSCDISGKIWYDDPVALASSSDCDIFVELIGGSDGPAKAAVEAALKSGKPVITANKALIAVHGAELAALAEEVGVPLLFEAAVMGGVPAVKVVREALVGDDIQSIVGILNGTCNYILTEMEATGRSFADVLAEAQRLGYAEADPTTDVGGFDAAHKISILAALAFNCTPNFDATEVEGIEQVELLDIQMAKDLGYRIKLIASARALDGGADFLHAGQHGRKCLQMHVGSSRNHARQRGLAGAGRTPQDHGMHGAGTNGFEQGLAGTEDVFLTDVGVERGRPHACGERLVALLLAKQRQRHGRPGLIPRWYR
jgi:hypothetical protein